MGLLHPTQTHYLECFSYHLGRVISQALPQVSLELFLMLEHALVWIVKAIHNHIAERSPLVTDPVVRLVIPSISKNALWCAEVPNPKGMQDSCLHVGRSTAAATPGLIHKVVQRNSCLAGNKR